jgi:hypothetical protein
MRRIVNKAVSLYLKTEYNALQKAANNPEATQRRLLKDLLRKGKKTAYGIDNGFSNIETYQDFNQKTKLNTYESIKPYIKEAMNGRRNVLWPGKVEWFSKSSGTTNDKSKYIPVTNENMYRNHIKSSWDTCSLLYHQKDVKMFENKCLILCGSIEEYENYKKSKIGDVSAILISNMQAIARPFYSPDFKTALISDWEQKIEKTAQIASKQKITMVGGVPTWIIVLFRRILEITGKSNMLEVWPDFRVYLHGGVGFEPYREIFQQFFPSDQVIYQEIYNASEGYFAAQDDVNSKGMLLLLRNGIFYEFVPLDELSKPKPKAIPLWEVQEGINYALVISTNAGLWRYMPGDTIKFTSTAPYRIMVTGRTKNFINTFGEEVMVSNTDKAIAETCNSHGAVVFDYTVAPVYLSKDNRGAHEWLIEFEKEPHDLNNFQTDLDNNLQRINSDYEAKRYKNIALRQLSLSKLPKNTFKAWLKSKGRQGSQIKVPRLSNDRKYVDDIRQFIDQNRIHV